MKDENEYTDIFGISSSTFEFGEKESEDKQSVFFNPNPNKHQGSNGLYKATIRFIPWHEDIKKSLISKELCYLKDPYTQEQRTVASYKSLGKAEGKNCPIMKHFWKLYYHEDASMQVKSELFKQSTRYYSLIQILDDEIHPENVGKIMIWGFGQHIFEKFQTQLIDNPKKKKVAKNPFNLFDGNAMDIYVYINGQYPKYEKCEFFDLDGSDDFGRPIYPSKFDKEGNSTEWLPVTKKDKDSQKAFLDYVKENSPNLVELCEFKPWDDDTKSYVQRVIDASLGNYSHANMDDEDEEDTVVATKIKTSKSQSAPVKKTAPKASAKVEEEIDTIVDDEFDIDDDDFDLDDEFDDVD